MAVLQKILVPLLAVNDTTLSVIEINFTSKEFVKKGSVLMVFETSKTTFEVVAETDGFVKIFCEVGKDYNVNEVAVEIYDNIDEIVIDEIISEKTLKNNNNVSSNEMKPNYQGSTLYSIAAEKLMNTNKISSDVFVGYEMVTVKDINSYLYPDSIEKVKEAKISKVNTSSLIKFPFSSTVQSKISNNKKREIEFLSSVQNAGLTSTIAINISTKGLFESINKHFKYFKNSLLPLLVYETSRLLLKYPLLNSYFSENVIHTYSDINIGFAIDIDKGLKVIKIPKTSELTIIDIEDKIFDLSNLYLEDKIPIENLTEISFTVTDLSGEGISYFKPLVNMYNSAILGISSIDNDLNRFNACITFDHRVTEGKYVAQFLNELKSRIESYSFNDETYNKSYECYKCLKRLNEDLSEVGLLPVITPNGKNKYICQTCWNGF